jgi:hypothetical protein
MRHIVVTARSSSTEDCTMKLSHYKLQEVEAVRISRQSADEGGKVDGPTLQQPLPPPFRYSFVLKAELTPAPLCGRKGRESNPLSSGLSRNCSTKFCHRVPYNQSTDVTQYVACCV